MGKKCEICPHIMWIQPVDTIELVIKGLVVGIIASAPMGPVGILTIQRTLNKGRWYGMITGVGAAVSDFIYAVITGVGLGFVMNFVENPRNMFWIKLVGSVLLFLFGLYTYTTNPTKKMHVGSKKKGTLIHNGVTGFLVTFSNPLIIFLFLALMARFEFVVPEHYFEQGLGYLSVFGGALAWWFGLTTIIDKARARFQLRTIWIINRIIGAIVMIASIAGAIYTLIWI